MRKLLTVLVFSISLVILLSHSVFAEELRTVIADVLNIRATPSMESEIIGKLYEGEAVDVIEFTDDTWVKISTGSGGYVARRYLGLYRTPQLGSRSGMRADSGDVITFAKRFLGKPYRYGGNGPDSFDCSGFVKYVYKNFGVELSRTTYTQVNEGTYVEKSDLQAGDLVFFAPGGNVNHVGIYISDNQFIHASSSGDYVKINSLNDSYYSKNYHTARRVK